MPNKLVTNFNIDENFWEANPQFKIALSFKDLYKSDRSKNKHESSKLMWFLSLTHDIASTYYNLPQHEKYEVIGEDFLGDIDYASKHEEQLDSLIPHYINLTTTVSERHLLEWDARMLDRTAFLAKNKYDLENFEKLDKMNANTMAMYNNLKKIKDDISKESSGGDTKGKFKESLNDSGEI
jgi:hypothetical protein